MANKKIDRWIVISAIIALVVLELAAISHGINGMLFAVIIAAIAGLAGWSAPQLKIIKS